MGSSSPTRESKVHEYSTANECYYQLDCALCGTEEVQRKERRLNHFLVFPRNKKKKGMAAEYQLFVTS